MNKALLQVRAQGIRGADVEIEEQLRDHFQAGRLAAGERMPATAVLARLWGVSCTSIQRAMNRLVAEGWVERKTRRGTFAKGATEQLAVAVVVGPSLVDEPAHFFRAVTKAVRAELEDRQCASRVYDGLSTVIMGRRDAAPVITQFSSDDRHHTFKGVIEIGTDLQQVTGLAARVACPRVRLGLSPSRKAGGKRQRFDVDIDFYRCARESTEFIAQHGRNPICFLRVHRAAASPRPAGRDRGVSEDVNGFRDAVAAMNLAGSRVEEILTTSGAGHILERAAYETTGRLIESWSAGGQWPGALLVSDDIAMRGVALALVQHQVPVPKRLLVMTFANEGIHHHYGIPVARYEISPAEIARKLIAILWKRIARENPALRRDEAPVLVAGAVKPLDLSPTR